MLNSKNINRIFTVLIIFALLVTSVLGLTFLQVDQSLRDSAASGFGESATSNFYTKTLEAFLNTPCTKIFPSSFFNNPNYIEIPKYLKSDYQYSTKSEINVPINCTFYFDNNKSINITAYTYTLNSLIADTRQNHFINVNYASLNNLYDETRIGIIDTFYGESKFEIGACSTNLFHPVNDFEYASIQYNGFDCADIINLNREIASVVGSYIFYTLENVYLVDGFSTQDLLSAFNSSEYIKDLNYYAN